MVRAIFQILPLQQKQAAEAKQNNVTRKNKK